MQARRPFGKMYCLHQRQAVSAKDTLSPNRGELKNYFESLIY